MTQIAINGRKVVVSYLDANWKPTEPHLAVLAYAEIEGRSTVFTVEPIIRVAGDVEGHDFHGNQWTHGGGGGKNVAEEKPIHGIFPAGSKLPAAHAVAQSVTDHEERAKLLLNYWEPKVPSEEQHEKLHTALKVIDQILSDPDIADEVWSLLGTPSHQSIRDRIEHMKTRMHPIIGGHTKLKGEIQRESLPRAAESNDNTLESLVAVLGEALKDPEIATALKKMLADAKNAGGWDKFKQLKLRAAGGPGSGNFGHEGRPGEVGGSGGSGGEHTAESVAKTHNVPKDVIDHVEARIRAEATTDAERQYAREMAVAENIQLKELATGDTRAKNTNSDGSYTPERLAEHDRIYREFFKDHIAKHGSLPPEGLKEPVVTFMAGMPGAGKSTAAQDLKDSPNVITIDPDTIKTYMKEFDGGLGASVVQRESGDIADKLMLLATERRMNIVIDGTMKTPGTMIAKLEDGALGKMAAFKDKGYRVETRFVDVNVDESIQNTVTRFAKDFKEKGQGRYVPTSFSRQLSDEKYGTLPRRSFELAKATTFRGKPLIDAWTDTRGFVPDKAQAHKLQGSHGTLTQGGGRRE